SVIREGQSCLNSAGDTATAVRAGVLMHRPPRPAGLARPVHRVTCSLFGAATEALMSFQIRPDESISHGLRRLGAKSLERMSEQLRSKTPPKDEAIHEARKDVKKVRAILEAVEADNGRGTGNGAKRLHRINRVLS